MNWLAWTVFAAFLIWVLTDGLRQTKGNTDLEGYFAGGRNIPWWAAGLSIMATQASAITVIGTAGQGHEGGLSFIQTYLALPFAMILLCLFLVPVLRSEPILTVYQYLERRFNPATRQLASGIFMLSRCAALGVVIYAPSVVLSAMTGLGLTQTVILIGVLTTIYTMFGGVGAVVATDVKQMGAIILGIIVTITVLLWDLLPHFDFDQMVTVLGAAGKLNALEPTPEYSNLVPRIAGSEIGDPSFWEQKYNLWSGLFGGLFLMLAYFGCDQSQAQRILTNPTANDSRKALLMSAIAKLPMQLGVLFMGVLIWLFHAVNGGPLLYNPADQARAAQPEHVEEYRFFEERYQEAVEQRRDIMFQLAALDNPREDPQLLDQYQQAVRKAETVRWTAAIAFSEGGRVEDTNYIFPHFILNNLHPLVLGLVMAGVFAAAMSSVDSILNSLSAATIVDFYKRWLRPKASDKESLRAAQFSTMAWGALATYAALFFVGGGSIVEQINRVGSFFYGSLLGVFTLALFVPRAKGWSGFWGLLGGMATVLLVHYTLRVEFLWYNVIGTLAVLAIGLSAVAMSALRSRRVSPDAAG